MSCKDCPWRDSCYNRPDCYRPYPYQPYQPYTPWTPQPYPIGPWYYYIPTTTSQS